MDMYVIKEGKRLRCGYTTGSCAAGAAKAAAIGLLTGSIPEYVEIDTPAGVVLKLRVENPIVEEDTASCCIVKDAGDDPDMTDGMEIYARVKRREDSNIVIDGGAGIGRITREGFFGKPGEAAINPVPRKMILSEVSKVTNIGLDITIYAPMGVEIGKKTFNSNIGIEGGISIIGTKGIVEPMSDEALKKSIYLEIDGIAMKGIDEILLYPGNYGEEFIKKTGIVGEGVKISNFIGDSILYCVYRGFKKITLVGNIGKLCKLSIGVFNTHSRICDGRIESLIYYLAIANAPYSLIKRVRDTRMTEEALKIIIQEGFGEIVKNMKKGCIEYLKRYVKNDDVDIDVLIYSMEYGLL